MCGVLAADLAALPLAVRGEVRAFFADNEAWLTRVLTDGVKRKELALRGSVAVNARLILAALEGAMIVARAHGSTAQFDAVADQVLSIVAHA
jgi:TetR/AcrR family transcriptional repressor of nem operon